MNIIGPNFNVTVGPNGSGKRSIVAALCIALGGDLKTLNRQMDLHSLINNDAGNQVIIFFIKYNFEPNIYAKKLFYSYIKINPFCVIF